MNILILNHHTNIDKYGSNSRHFKISNYLTQQGHQVLLVASSYNHRKGEYIHEDKLRYDQVNENFGFISIKSKPKYKNNVFRFLNYFDFTFKTLFLKLKFKPDIVVGSSVHPFVWISAYRLAKKYDAEFHIEIRDIWPLSLYEEIPKIFRKPIFILSNLFESYYYKKAKSIIVTAPLASNYLSDEHNIERRKVNYVPHGIDILKFDSLKKKFHTNIIRSEKINVTYTGALSASEGLDNLILLAEEFKNNSSIHFNIIGGGNQKKHLLSMVKKKKLNNVTFHEHIKSLYIPDILVKSDILWCGLKNRKAFKYSISKNKFYEYLASEKPIIFHSDVISSSLEESKAAYVIGLDKMPIKELDYLVKNPQVRKSMGTEGRKFVERYYDISNIANKFIRDFE